MKEKHEHSRGLEVDRRVTADTAVVAGTVVVDHRTGMGLANDTVVEVRYSQAVENAEVQESMAADTCYSAEDTAAEMEVAAAVLATEVAGKVAAAMHLAAVGSPDLAGRAGKAAEASTAVAQIRIVVEWKRHLVEVGEDMVTQVLVQA